MEDLATISVNFILVNRYKLIIDTYLLNTIEY